MVEADQSDKPPPSKKVKVISVFKGLRLLNIVHVGAYIHGADAGNSAPAIVIAERNEQVRTVY